MSIGGDVDIREAEEFIKNETERQDGRKVDRVQIFDYKVRLLPTRYTHFSGQMNNVGLKAD